MVERPEKLPVVDDPDTAEGGSVIGGVAGTCARCVAARPEGTG